MDDGVPGGDAGIAAREFAFEPKELTVAAGAAQVKMTNEGSVFHTLVLDGVPAFGKLAAEHGEVATGELTLPAGTYSFYCDQAGHRSAGMEGTLIIT
jgi:plastocyanin